MIPKNKLITKTNLFIILLGSKFSVHDINQHISIQTYRPDLGSEVIHDIYMTYYYTDLLLQETDNLQ